LQTEPGEILLLKLRRDGEILGFNSKKNEMKKGKDSYWTVAYK
jgi:hypothetical protein